jgi:tetratricopeptide (TPR) repeat protein
MAAKPRAFIGSSVEGLSVAYSVSQNLLHDVEATVWSQGVFELSSTSIESLTKVLETSDFAIFVFTPDDQVKLRGQVSPSVRDNVLFEMGLFLGKLGRERVFFLVPDGIELHIPTDLLGVTPAKYQTDRSDKNMDAATGVACNQMRIQIKNLPPLVPQSPPSSPEAQVETAMKERSWWEDFFDNKYAEARQRLEREAKGKTGEDAAEDEAWMYYCDLKLDERDGLAKLIALSKSRADSIRTQKAISLVLRLENYSDRAIQLLNDLPSTVKDTPEIKIALSACYASVDDTERALAIFDQHTADSEPLVALHMAGILEGKERKPEAMQVVHSSYLANPNHKELRYKYALLAQDQGEEAIALYLLNELTRDFSDKDEFWGYLGNSCLALGMHDRALVAYRLAEKLTGTHEGGWIVGNIGNLFSNLQLPSEGIPYFETVLKNDLKTEYANEKLAGALKKRDEKLKEYNLRCAEGKQKIRARDKVTADDTTSNPAVNLLASFVSLKTP